MSRIPRWYAAAGPAYLVALLAIDTQLGYHGQLVLGGITWIVLLAALRPLPALARARCRELPSLLFLASGQSMLFMRGRRLRCVECYESVRDCCGCGDFGETAFQSAVPISVAF